MFSDVRKYFWYVTQKKGNKKTKYSMTLIWGGKIHNVNNRITM